MNFKFKKYIGAVIFFISVYTAAWFYAAHHFKNIVKNFPYKEANQEFSFKDMHIGGFPFELKANLTGIDFKYKVKNILLNISLDLSADTLNLSSNFLANKIVITFPENLSISINNNDKVSKFDILSDKEHYLELHEKNLVNIHKIIYNLYKSKAITFDTFKLGGIYYKSKKLHFMNKDDNQELFNSASDIKLQIQHKSDKIDGIYLKTNNLINIIGSKFVGHDFKQLSSNIDVSTRVKPYGNILSILSANFNLVNLKIDNFSLKLTGKAKNNTDREPEVDLALTITDFNNFINSLETQNLVSKEKVEILNGLMKHITGEPEINNTNIKIYSAKDESIRIGNIDTETLSIYFHQLIMGR